MNEDENGVDTKADDFVLVDVDETFIVLYCGYRQIGPGFFPPLLDLNLYVDGYNGSDVRSGQDQVRGGPACQRFGYGVVRIVRI